MKTHSIPSGAMPAMALEGPAIPGLCFRQFQGNSDLPAMVAVANASDAADGVQVVRTLEAMTAGYAALVHCDPCADVVLADVDGCLVGYARGWWKEEVGGAILHLQTGFVSPAWRRRGIGHAMQRWLEGRQRAIGRQFPAGRMQLFNVYVTEPELARAALLESAGYTVARYLFTMVRPSLDLLPRFAVPSGLAIRPVEPEHYPEIWAADQEAMREHWGRTEPGEDAYATWLSDDDTFQPALWSVAWDVATHQVVGQVRAFFRAAENARLGRQRGHTEFISVRAPWRGRGVARALIAHSLMVQARAGMTESALEVDGAHPSEATRIYASCGFETTTRNMVYRKPL